MEKRCAKRWMLLVGVLAALLVPTLAVAHLAGVESETPAVGAPSAEKGGGEVGVDERLGQKIPLDITFRDESGRSLRLSQLISGPTIIVPVYYRCSNVCNFLQGDLARVIPQIRSVPGRDYRILSVSIDETETPRDAAASRRMYLAAMNLPLPANGWHFLTGDAASIRRLTDAAGYHFQRRGHEFMHPVATFVVAGDGMIVRYLYGTNFLPKDLSLAFLEAGQGRVGGAVRHMVTYCFSFDPATRSYQFNLLRVTATAVIFCCGSFFAFLLFTGRRKSHRSGDK